MPASPDNQNLYFVMNSYLLYILKANISAQTSFIFNNRGSFEGSGYLLREVERMERLEGLAIICITCFWECICAGFFFPSLQSCELNAMLYLCNDFHLSRSRHSHLKICLEKWKQGIFKKLIFLESSVYLRNFMQNVFNISLFLHLSPLKKQVSRHSSRIYFQVIFLSCSVSLHTQKYSEHYISYFKKILNDV